MSRSAPLFIPAAIVGAEVGPVSQDIDARWLMAYAAGLGLTDPRYYDTRQPGGPRGHPLFAVCYEWPVALEIRARTIPDEIATLSVHATHHAVIHRPPRAGDRLLTSARVVGVSRRRAGTLVTTRFTTVDDRGAPVTTTDYGSVYRGVDCDAEVSLEPATVGAWRCEPQPGAGEASETQETTRRGHRDEPVGSSTTTTRGCGGAAEPPRTAREAHDTTVRWSEPIEVPAWAAHVYTECARIWNPIHTDAAVAAAAGLPGIILHGTATLALAVSRVIARDLDGDATRVREIGARFTGMVLIPSIFTVRGLEPAADRLHFNALDDAGGLVLSDAWLRL